MLTVDHYELIRRKVRDGMTQRNVAKALGHSRNTVAKALNYPIPPGYRMAQSRTKPAIAPFTHILDEWIEQNKHTRRKQRMSATRMYARLCDEYNFIGHYSTVQRYIKEATHRRQEVFMPLAFDPGEEAQVDWHEAVVYENHIQKKVYLFCMKQCFSKAPFVCSYESMTIECFLDGHVRAFEYFGGVPRRIAYDNLKTAVIKVLKKGKRKLNKRFKELRSWYLFDTRFCNVAKGNEKGDVENLAKRSERQFFAPIPHVSSLEDLNDKLLSDCVKELGRKAPAPHTDKTIGDLLEEEKVPFYELPPQTFEACRRLSTFPDKHLLVRVDTNRYSIPTEYAYRSCQIKVFVDKVAIYFAHELIASHKKCYQKEQYILDPMHYIKLLERKPGSLDNARAFKGQPWGQDFELMRSELEYRYGSEGTGKYIAILLLFTEYPQSDVKEAVSLCVKCRAFSDEAVSSFLRHDGHLDLSDNRVLVNQGNGKRPLSIYDRLSREGCFV